MRYDNDWGGLGMSSSEKENEKIKNDNLYVIREDKIIFYSNDETTVNIDVYFADETFWLTQKTMSTLFGVDIRTINEHLKNIYDSGELLQEATIRNFRIVQKEGTRDIQREVMFYNLDAIISVGYRVNSKQATQFRRWATQTLREFVVKGFVLNDKILENAGEISHDMAMLKADEEYDKFRIKQDNEYVSDFDVEFEKYLKGQDEPQIDTD